jgi:tetratricopeptide (TPR) repeat protein
LFSDDEALADEHIARNEWSQAVTILARITDPNVRVLNKHGCLLREHLGDIPGALHCHQQALLKAFNREKAETLIYLGLVLHNMKQYAEAYKVYTEALQWLENAKKQDPSLIARCLVGMGNAQWACRQLDEALDFAERALAIREYEIKPRNNLDVAACLGNMGNILHDQGNIERALSCATRAVDLLSESGKDDSRLAAALNNLGAMHQANGDLVKAREYFELALETLPDEDHPYRKSTSANIARLNMAEQSKK